MWLSLINSSTAPKSGIDLFDNGIVAHVPFGTPFAQFSNSLRASQESDATVHDGSTYVCMEGLLSRLELDQISTGHGAHQ